MSSLSLSGRTAIVAGGSAGIGRAIVEAFHREGVSVGVIARDGDRLAEIEAAYGGPDERGVPPEGGPHGDDASDGERPTDGPRNDGTRDDATRDDAPRDDASQHGEPRSEEPRHGGPQDGGTGTDGGPGASAAGPGASATGPGARRDGPRVATASADVADSAALDAAADALVAELGAPDIWVNCAMLTSFSPFEEMGAEEFERIVDVTLIGQVNGCRAALRHMKGGGDPKRIVNVGSGLAYRSVPFQSAYCASKAAINGFTASLRSELMRQERPVTLSLVQLPAVNTPQFDWARNRLEKMPQPAPPIYAPQAAAEAVLRAARTGPRELLVGQSVLKLVFGHLIAPGWLDRQMAESGAKLQKSQREEPGDRPDNLHDPVAYPASAEGSFSDRQKSDAVTIDGGLARAAVFAGVPALLLLVGLALG